MGVCPVVEPLGERNPVVQSVPTLGAAHRLVTYLALANRPLGAVVGVIQLQLRLKLPRLRALPRF